MIEKAGTKEEAIAIAQKADRTWSVWLGVGDFASQKARTMRLLLLLLLLLLPLLLLPMPLLLLLLLLVLTSPRDRFSSPLSSTTRPT